MHNQKVHVSLPRSRIIKALILSALVLTLLHGLGLFFTHGLDIPYAKGFVPLFNFDLEANIPSFYSVMLLIISSILFFWISLSEHDQISTLSRKWRLLSLIFFFLAIDESATIHELLIAPLRESFDLKGFFFFSWVIIGMAVVIFLGGYFFRFVAGLPSKFRTELLLAAALYLAGALGIEMTGGNYVFQYGYNTLTYALITTLEELLEITGLIILINALIKYLQTYQTTLELSVKE